MANVSTPPVNSAGDQRAKEMSCAKGDGTPANDPSNVRATNDERRNSGPARPQPTDAADPRMGTGPRLEPNAIDHNDGELRDEDEEDNEALPWAEGTDNGPEMEDDANEARTK